MDFKIQSKRNENVHQYPNEDVDTAKEFSKKLKDELDDFLIATVLFGSAARDEASDSSDIDVLVIGDDISFELTDEMMETYKIIVEEITGEVSEKLHITSMTFTSFWEYVKAGDPVAVNILRDGVPIIDSGFFTPLQELLKKGKIKPTEESIWRYFGRAPKTLTNSRWHILQATLDLYWSVIDAAHAALMRKGVTPPNPEDAADLMEEELVEDRMLEQKYVETMRKFYRLKKQITHREIKEVKGAEYDSYLEEARDFVNRMKRLIQEYE